MDVLISALGCYCTGGKSNCHWRAAQGRLCRVNPLLEISVLVDGGGDRRRRGDGFDTKAVQRLLREPRRSEGRLP